MSPHAQYATSSTLMPESLKRPYAVFFLVASLLFLLPDAIASAVEMTNTGTLASGDTYGYGVTSSGVVVGDSEDGSGNPIAYIWRPGAGLVSLGTLGGTKSYAYGVSADGTMAVGESIVAGAVYHAYYWTAATGMVDINKAAISVDSGANGVSSDKTVIVGSYEDLGGLTQSFYWTSLLGMTKINAVAGGTESCAYGTNRDGSVIVGVSDNGVYDEAYRWTASTNTATGLGVIAPFGGASSSLAYNTNADGSVVVGSSTSSTSLFAAFRWTEATGMADIGNLGGFITEALAVSDSGDIVVGYSMNSDGDSEGFVWTSLGMRSVNAMLTDAGVDMTGLFVHECTGISGDGTTIVGNGLEPSNAAVTFLIREAGITTASALYRSLGELSAAASDISYMAMGTMRGIMDQADHLPEPGTARLWLVGSLLGDASVPGDDMGGEGGFGISLPLADGLTLGTGMFMGRRSVDLQYNGNQISNMLGPGAFLSYAPEPYGWRAKVGALYEHASLELNRGYPNGGTTSVAKGDTEGHVFSLSGHLGYIHPLTPVLAVQPYVEYDLQATILDAYTETDTPFPAHFDERRDVMNKARLGAELRCSAWDNLDLWGWGAWSHRFDEKGPSMEGYLIGLSDFSYGGGTIDRDWAEIGGGVKYRPSERTEMFSRVTFALENQHYAAPDAALNTGVSWSF